MNFEEGESYRLDELPDSDMTASGNLELVDRDGTLAARFGDLLVEFEHETVVCTDVTHVDEL